MSSIEARISAIAAAVERRKMEQEWPEDGLSRSLREFGAELAELDTQGKAALLEALNTPGEDGTSGLDLDMEAIDRMIADLKG
ncbi:hypothetical protein AALA80_19625 [Oscillospiraceae bacterium 50-60]